MKKPDFWNIFVYVQPPLANADMISRNILVPKNLIKKINDIWTLINETAVFLERTALRGGYDDLIAQFRARLQNTPVNSAVLQDVQSALTEIRKRIRLSGYDLSMGKFDLVFDGFHNDDVGGAFSRMVLFIGGQGAFYWKTGNENHIELTASMEKQMHKIKETNIAQKHFLWYKWTKTSLILSGSASESKESYQKLMDYAQADPLLFLTRIKKL